MGQAIRNPKVKLIIGFIFKNAFLYEKTRKILIKKFGKIDFESKLLDFNYTDYYQNELGPDLKRRFISFKNPLYPEKIVDIKIYTNALEKRLSLNSKRQINIDPGYVDLSKLVLATVKDYNHRIYLNKGIYAEITLTFQGTSFTSWPWTYPDYNTKDYIEIFNNIRAIYKRHIDKTK